MSIYAANNILCGIKNLDPDGNRIAGIIYNSRGAGDDKEKVIEFAKAVGLPICLSIPRSERFLEAEKKAVTQVEMDRDSREAKLFLSLAGDIKNGIKLSPSLPLSEEQMEAFMQGKSLDELQEKYKENSEVTGSFGDCESCEEAKEEPPKDTIPGIGPIPSKKRALSDPFSRQPLFGCAYRGAMDLAVQIKDAYVLGHAPKSCTSYTINGVTSYGRSGLFTRGIIYPAFIPQHYDNTDINIEDAVFGGVEHAREKALELVKKGAKDIIVVTACIPGLSGDDLEPLKKELKGMGVEMYIVHSDGVEEGSYNEGMALCYKTLAREAVKPVKEIDKDSINLVYELSWSLKRQDNYLKLEEIFKALGIRVNCRFLYDTTMKDINNFMKAPYSLMARDDKLGLEIKRIFEDRYGCKFIEGPLPMGFREMKRFVSELGRLYSKEVEAALLIEKNKSIYEDELANLKKEFKGKTAMIFLSSPASWLSELTEDLDLEIQEFFLPEKREKDSEWRHRFSKEWENDVNNFLDKVKKYNPELVIASDFSVLSRAEQRGCKKAIFAGSIDLGFLSGLEEARKWLTEKGSELEGRWKNDKYVFEKYYG